VIRRTLRRFPAEWEWQDATLIAWPHAGTDWAPWLADVEQCYVALARAVLARQRLLVLVPTTELAERVEAMVGLVHGRAAELVIYDYDDTWLRDSGPVTVHEGAKRIWLDFSFTGWGGKYAGSRDDALVRFLATAEPIADVRRERHEFALEGGAIETDGEGTLLSTWTCLSRRHPEKSRGEVEHLLAATLGVDRFLWLEQGELSGDDTDAHIDTLARFAARNAIVYQGCDDPTDPHYPALTAMADEIRAFTARDGRAYRRYALPFAPRIEAADGRRLAASYANFLIVNGAVLMPGYGVSTDAAAAAVLALAFPEREIVTVPCRPLIEQNGSLHCVTMQLTEGALR